MELGVQGTGLMWIEHFELVSVADDRINDYGNCLYACRFCNSSRYVTRTNDDGRSLLDPCSQIWSERFSLDEDDRLLPAEADPDACYTFETYDINDSRKVRLRRLRRERLADWLDLIREGGSRIRSLLELSQRVNLEDATFLLAEAMRLHHRIDFAKVQDPEVCGRSR